MKTILLYLILLLATLLETVDAAKSGRSKNRARVSHGHAFKFIIPDRNAKNYYDNKDGARITKASHFEQDYSLGRKITFLCMAEGIPRPGITWFKDGSEFYYHKYFTVYLRYVGNTTTVSKMEIDPAVQKDAGYYECQADNLYAIDRRGFRADFITSAF